MAPCCLSYFILECVKSCISHLPFSQASLIAVNVPIFSDMDWLSSPSPETPSLCLQTCRFHFMIVQLNDYNSVFFFQAEVSQLEGSLESDQPIFPPYLVAHTSALCDALPSLKQLTQTARCIVIIPQAGKSPLIKLTLFFLCCRSKIFIQAVTFLWNRFFIHQEISSITVFFSYP